MHDPNMVDRRVRDRRKSIPLTSPPTAYKLGARYLVIPQDLSRDFALCNAKVDSLDGYGAWISPLEDHVLPEDEALLLVEFEGEWVLTHHCKVVRREAKRVLVGASCQTDRERSQLAPTTGRHDYRIRVNLPVRIRSQGDQEDADQGPKLARLVDLSRGGMALLTPASQTYTVGETITVRVVSWDHAVHIDAVVHRVGDYDEDGKQKIALRFPEEMSLRQRESVSTFIIQVQRRDALSRALPSDFVDEEPFQL